MWVKRKKHNIAVRGVSKAQHGLVPGWGVVKILPGGKKNWTNAREELSSGDFLEMKKAW